METQAAATDCSCHQFADLGAAVDRLAVVHTDESHRAAFRHLADAFAALGWLVGADGRFQIVMQVGDAERFRALGPHQKELPLLDTNGPFVVAVRVIDLGAIKVTAFCRFTAA